MQGELFVVALLVFCATQEYMRRTVNAAAKARLEGNVKFYDAPDLFRRLHPGSVVNWVHRLLFIAMIVLSAWGIKVALLGD